MQNKEWFFTVACFGAIRKNAEILFSFPMKILQKTVRFLPKLPSEASLRIRAVFPFPFGNKANPFRFKGF